MGCARCTGRRGEGGQASGGSRRDGCTRDWPGRGPQTPPTRSRTISAIIRPAREDGCGAVGCSAVWCGAVQCGVVRCGAWRGRGESGRPIRVELHSVHAAMRLHNCRRLPRFHQLESRASTWRGVLRVCCRACWGVGRARRLSDVEISTPGSARVHWPRENNAELDVIERVGVRRGCTCIVAREYS